MDVFNIFNSFTSLMHTFGIADLLDVCIVAFIIYSMIKITRETRAEQLVKGIVILVITYILSDQLNLKMLRTILNSVFEFGVIVLIVVFQPELRRTLEQIGRSKLGDYWSFLSNKEEEYINLQSKAIKAVVNAVESFKESRTGALIVFERKTKLGDIVSTGTIINAKPSAAIIGNIFYNKAPLHDGAMIIKDGIVYAAGCILPLTQNDDVSIDLGTRHRAALGISENSDAVVVIVSEETGSVSTAVNGILRRGYSREILERELLDLLIYEKGDSKSEKLKKRRNF